MKLAINGQILKRRINNATFWLSIKVFILPIKKKERNKKKNVLTDLNRRLQILTGAYYSPELNLYNRTKEMNYRQFERRKNK